jgi:hypothetical protein
MENNICFIDELYDPFTVINFQIIYIIHLVHRSVTSIEFIHKKLRTDILNL